MRIAKGDDAPAGDHGDDRVAAYAPAHAQPHRVQDVLVVRQRDAHRHDFGREARAEAPVERLEAVALSSTEPGRGLAEARLQALEEATREYVEQHLRVRARVHMPPLRGQLQREFLCIDQVAVVGEREAKRRVDVERLGLR